MEVPLIRYVEMGPIQERAFRDGIDAVRKAVDHVFKAPNVHDTEDMLERLEAVEREVLIAKRAARSARGLNGRSLL